MTKYILGVVALFLIGGVWWYVQSNNNGSATTASAVLAPGEKPWIEVVTAAATAEEADGTITTLATGDEITIGSVVKTDTTGVVLVHFPDGSFAKLDPDSSVTITEAGYDEASGALNVHLTLGVGTLWSKVLDLVGANSSWQVETSNAVATVRGTSFMTSKIKGKTKVVGIENKVTVTPLQPDTRQPLSMQADVTTDTQVTIDDTRISALASGKEKLATTTMSADIQKSGAYKAFKEREEQFDALRDSLRAKSKDDAEFRKEFRESRVKDFKDTILEKREKPAQPSDQAKVLRPTDAGGEKAKTETTAVPARTSPEAVVKTVTPKPTAAGPTVKPESQSGATPDALPVSLSITSDHDISRGITEKDTIIFRAILLLSDNSKKDVTDSVKWNVINDIGVFPAPGNFRAQLLPNAAELGEVPGAIYATFKGSDGKELNAASPQFTVHAYVPPQTSTAG